MRYKESEMFKVGDKVYTTYPESDVRGVVVIGVNYPIITCEFEEYISRRNNMSDGWYKTKRDFMYYELRQVPFETEDRIHIRNKWTSIINRISNMRTSVSSLYKQVIEGCVILSPEYQRGLVWTLKQKQAYIEALYNEKAIISPTIILNWCAPTDKNSKEVIDGKQRLTTIFDFIENKFKLSNGKYFKELSAHDCRFLLNHDVSYTRIEKLGHTDLTLEEKIELFLEINELGTKMSNAHIKKVKQMLEKEKQNENN